MGWLIDNIGASIVSFIIGGFLTWLWAIRKNLKVYTHTLFRRDTDYRVSAAYLFKIQIDNKYLLIKGNRIEQFQPVGGVYKYYNSFGDKYNQMQLRQDDDSNFYENRDLRIYVKGKFLQKFLNWFDSKENREYTVEREFREELVKTGILQEEILKDVRFEYVRRVNKGIEFSTHFKCFQVLIFDIFNVHIDNENALEQIKNYVSENEDLTLVSFDEIERECVNINGKSVKIGAHAKEIR